MQLILLWFIDIFFCFSWSIDNKIVGGRGGSAEWLRRIVALLLRRQAMPGTPSQWEFRVNPHYNMF